MPSIRQRVILVAAILVGAVIWLSVLTELQPRQGSAGIVLLTARAGLPLGYLLLCLAGIPALGLALVSAASGSVLSGPFAVGCALGVLAAAGGPIDGYLRGATMPAAYLRLSLETLLWLLGLAIVLWVLGAARAPLRSRLPSWLVSQPLDAHEIAWPDSRAAAAALLCAAVSAAVGLLLLRSSDSGQVLASICMAFCVGGLAARSAFGPFNPTGVLLTPAFVALAAYLWMAARYGSTELVLSNWYLQRLPGLALALPIHYFSAGLAGAALGLGWGQMLAAPKTATA